MSICQDDAEALYKDIQYPHIYALVYTLHAGAAEPSVKKMHIYLKYGLVYVNV